MLTKAAKLFFTVAAPALVGVLAFAHGALAQETFQEGASMSSQTSEALGVSAEKPEDHAIPIGNWLVYPSFSTGYIFNDNVYGRSYNRIGASGIRVRPAIEALLENGIHRTMAYVDADFQAYPGLGAAERYVNFQRVIDAPPSNVAGRAGILHVWQPLQDLTVRASVDATRQTGLLAPYFGASSGHSFLPTAISFSSVQQYTNQFSGVLSVEKKIGERGFVRAIGTGFYTSYDNRPTFASVSPADNFYQAYATNAFGGNYQGGFGFRGALRAGGWLTPQIYAFAEPGIDLRRYSNAAFDSNGYRMIAGLGSDMWSLFRGEIYGGYQSQASVNGMFGRTSAPAYGARIFYYPTREVSLSLSADQSLSSTSSAPMLATGVTAPFWHLGGERWASAARTRQILAQGEYTFSSQLAAYVRGGYGDTTFDNPHFSTSAWSAGGGVNYQIWRNLSVSVDYQFLKTRLRTEPALRQTAVASFNGVAQGFSRNVVSVGLNWRF